MESGRISKIFFFFPFSDWCLFNWIYGFLRHNYPQHKCNNQRFAVASGMLSGENSSLNQVQLKFYADSVLNYWQLKFLFIFLSEHSRHTFIWSFLKIVLYRSNGTSSTDKSQWRCFLHLDSSGAFINHQYKKNYFFHILMYWSRRSSAWDVDYLKWLVCGWISHKLSSIFTYLRTRLDPSCALFLICLLHLFDQPESLQCCGPCTSINKSIPWTLSSLDFSPCRWASLLA